MNDSNPARRSYGVVSIGAAIIVAVYLIVSAMAADRFHSIKKKQVVMPGKEGIFQQEEVYEEWTRTRPRDWPR